MLNARSVQFRLNLYPKKSNGITIQFLEWSGQIGRERELVMSISRKAIVQNLSITSAFQRDSFHGHLYVEARSEAHIREALHGLVGVYISNTPVLVPIEEMPDLLKSRRKEIALTVGGWVRIKRGTYKGDLAQVDDVPESGEMLTLKVVPRIDLNPREDKESGVVRVLVSRQSSLCHIKQNPS